MTNLVTREQLAAQRGCSKDTVTTDIRSGKLKAVRVGNRVFIPIEAADSWRQPIPIQSGTKTNGRGAAAGTLESGR
jgi:excisionase family DNA binding protein